jgi:protein-S-isoprenylcysteine O-methyltransferase Ste14
MHPETPYRIAVGAIFVVSMSIAAYHRIQAARSGERISHEAEGRTLFLTIRLCGVFLLLGAAGYLLRPSWVEWAQLSLPGPVRWIGAAVGVASIGLLFWTLTTLGRNLTDTVVTRIQHTLVTRGPYRWIRHPFYVAMLLLVTAFALLAANWFIALAGWMVFILLAIRAPLEERKLVERFGDDYRDYMQRTPRFFPRVFPRL